MPLLFIYIYVWLKRHILAYHICIDYLREAIVYEMINY